jgi:hypothetical protein
MYCKDCRFRNLPTTPGEFHPYCTSEKIVENDNEITYRSDGDRLVYSYSESGTFYVEDYFGCVHFERTDAEIAMEHFNKGQ